MSSIATIGIVGAVGSAYAGSQSASAQKDAASDAQAMQYGSLQAQQKATKPYRQSAKNALSALDIGMGLVPELSREDLVKQNAKKFKNPITGEVDTAKLNAFVDRKMAENAKLRSNPEFGSLMKKFDASQMYQDPGYQARLAEGQKGIENSAAARGMQLSGANLKALDRYSQDYASNEYSNAYNKFVADQQNKYNRLAGMSNPDAVNQTNATVANYATSFGQGQADKANAQSELNNTYASSFGTALGSAGKLKK